MHADLIEHRFPIPALPHQSVYIAWTISESGDVFTKRAERPFLDRGKLTRKGGDFRLTFADGEKWTAPVFKRSMQTG